MNRYTSPRPSQSTINRSLYCSNGYLVFIPDIVYRTGYPGQSAYDAVVSGVYFLALRRLDKPVWMLSYNGEPHNLKLESWANHMDLDKRMFQFFNHFLIGAAMPEWMEKRIAALDKGKETGY